MAWFWGAYALGFLFMVRYVVLEIQDDFDRENFEHAKKGKNKRSSWEPADVFLVIFAGSIWYLIVGFYVLKFLMFPRGLKSKFTREQEKLAKAEEAEARAAKAEEDLRRMQDEVLRFAPQGQTEYDESLRRLQRVITGARLSDGDDSNFTSSYCTTPVDSSVQGMLTSCGEPSVPGTHHCHRHLADGPGGA